MAEYSQIDLIHEDFKKSRETDTRTFNKLPSNVKVLMIVGIGISLWWFGLRANNWKTAGLVSLGILAAAYIWATSEENAGKGELTDLQLRTLLYKQLKYYQLNAFGSHYIIPDGEIRIMANVARWTVDETAKYRTYGVEIKMRNSLSKHYSVDVNIYTGDIVKVQEGYFTGKERPNIKYIESVQLAQEKRYQEAMGKLKPGTRPGGGV